MLNECIDEIQIDTTKGKGIRNRNKDRNRPSGRDVMLIFLIKKKQTSS